MKRLLLLLLAPLVLSSCGGSSEQDFVEIRAYASGKERGAYSCVGCMDDFRAIQTEPVAPGTPCTRIYGGPEEIVLRARLDGQNIFARFNKMGGCEIERFATVERFLRQQGIDPDKLFGTRQKSSSVKNLL